jgi:uncharacterized membrane protein
MSTLLNLTPIFLISPILLIFLVIFIVRFIKRYERRAEERLQIDKQHMMLQQRKTDEMNERLKGIEKMLTEVN